MRKVFTIIKENSKRLPNKNFLELGGKPLWRWLVDELHDFEVYVNTDSLELLEELKGVPHVKTISRSQIHIDWEKNAEKLGSPVMDMVKEFCENHVNSNENFALGHVTSPFLQSNTLEKAFSELEDYDFYSVHSVKKIQDCIMSDKDGVIVPDNFSFTRVSRTQDLEPIYQSLGAFFILNSSKLLGADYERLSSNSLLYPVSAVEAIEIDNEDDYELAKFVAQTITGDKL